MRSHKRWVGVVAGMVGTPLVPKGGATRRVLSSVVVTSLFATTTHSVARRWGPRSAAASVAAIVPATALVERIGTATGVPFGRYAYTGSLRPRVAGVPAIVPLAWFAMAVPARESAHSALGVRSTPATRIALGACALTAWDLFLDPQMVCEGYWRWARVGRYRGIPLSNFVGWLATSAVVMAALEVILPPTDDPDPELVSEYGFMATMETLGFAAFFKDRVVAAVGGVAMMPMAIASTRRWWARHG